MFGFITLFTVSGSSAALVGVAAFIAPLPPLLRSAGGITGDRPLFPGVFTQNVPAFDADSNRRAQDSYIQPETVNEGGKKKEEAVKKTPVIASDCQRHLHPAARLFLYTQNTFGWWAEGLAVEE